MSNIGIAIAPYVVFALAVIPAAIRAWDIGRRLSDAIETSHVPPKTVAEALGISETVLSRWIAGRGPDHMSGDRLTKLPRPVAILFWLAWGEELGLVEPAAIRAERDARAAFHLAHVELHDNAGEMNAAVA